jgi:hypothetical protein
MSEEFVDRATILMQLEKIIGTQELIAEYVDNRICQKCGNDLDEEWVKNRSETFKRLRNLIDKYTFSKKLPRNDLGIAAQAIISHLLNIQHTFLRVMIMIDMLHQESFNEIFMDSMTTISKKVHQMMTALKVMVNQSSEDSEEIEDTLELIIKLERQIDEDNIIICRQISIATGGDSDFACYMMRKIVAELEHISDYVKECAEIFVEI